MRPPSRALRVLTAVLVIGVAFLLLWFTEPVARALRTRLVSYLIGDAVEVALDRDARNLQRARQRLAAQESARFVLERMPRVKSFPDKQALLVESLAAVDPKLGGLYCEFGVYTGGTINFIAEAAPHQIIHGFDSFEGLPEDWRDGFGKGRFGVDRLPRVRSNVRLHKGWFDQVLPGFKRDHPGPLAFLHMDADLYSSTKTVFDILGDRVAPGTVIQFDEFLNYPGWQQGEFKAFEEFAAARGLAYDYLGFVPGGEQVALKIKAVAKPQ